MKLKERTSALGCTKSYEWRGAEYSLGIHSMSPDFAKDKDKLWYFVITKHFSVFAYNSSIDNVTYTTKEECIDAAKEKIVALVEEDFPKEQDNVHRSNSFFL